MKEKTYVDLWNNLTTWFFEQNQKGTEPTESEFKEMIQKFNKEFFIPNPAEED